MIRLQALPREILRHVLDELEPNPDELIPVDRRYFLSSESLDRPSPPPRSCIEDIASFRLACSLFADVGAPLLFTRVVTRLDDRDLTRLEKLSEWRVSRHVRRLSYLVPYFFNTRSVQRQLGPTNGYPGLHLDSLQRRADERQHILESKRDAKVLQKAIRAFTSLQHVRILPLADIDQNRLLRLMRQDSNLSTLVDLDWTSACYHCSRTIGAALLDANLTAIRFSYPKLNPRDAQYFASKKLRSISNIAATLTSLTIQFEEVYNLDKEVQELSCLFGTVFSRAENLEAIHIGFLSTQPLDLALEDVFQNITWKRLVALGIHGWNVHADEIVNLALRHREKLRGLRLRKVFLKEGSRWVDALDRLRQQMRSLNWISLTGIGYVSLPARAVEETNGIDAHDDDDDASENSTERQDSDSGDEAAPHTHHANGSISSNPTTAGSNGLQEDDDFYGDNDSERNATEIEFMDLNASKSRASLAVRCTCEELAFRDANDAFSDDGVAVSASTAKQWERWVVNRCQLHGRR